MRTVHELTVTRLKLKYPQAHTRGFAKKARALFIEGDGPDADSEPPRFESLQPDLWWYEAPTLTCIEVEDGHPLTLDKILAYETIRFYLDCVGFDLDLFVTDRYGDNLKPIPLFEYGYISDAR